MEGGGSVRLYVCVQYARVSYNKYILKSNLKPSHESCAVPVLYALPLVRASLPLSPLALPLRLLGI